MEQKKNKWIRRFHPQFLADMANQGFVELAGILARLANLGAPIPTERESNSEGLCRQQDRSPSNDAQWGTRKSERFSALDRGTLSNLAQKVDRIVKNDARFELVEFSGECLTSGKSLDQEMVRSRIKELFQDDERRRLAAVVWFRKHRCQEAKPALAGVFTIEENHEIRCELRHALKELGGVTPKDKEI